MNISPAIQKTVGRGLLQAQKYSPQALTVVGVVGVVVAGVLAAKATLKLEKTLDESAQDLADAKQAVADGEESSREITKVYIRNSMDLVRLYGPSITLGVVSLACLVGANGILQKRNVALAAAYKGLESAFGNYRKRVIEEHGEETDRDYRQGFRKETITDDKGKKQVVSVPVDGEKVGGSEFLFDFGPGNPNWTGFHDHNLYFVTAQQNMHNDLLKARGHVFLNEILDSLGLERTKAGQIVGWVYDPKGGAGDNFIDFGIRDMQEERGYILLDFNVDGNIFDKI